ncbi:phosphonoacetaldehyde hydrolase [Bremerella cremea]|uniref:phosphonoacetaldehyde hydrolase n=1 Tax=Bremerella cremea TaxID=1031537 RepID=A0A368KWB9_9BACT|nr:phosphonoacetaldehyde hydrolase [Bremerella cremea]RCS53925.1 phosphonoacetaldehyde hydrolase [Bremerella cremea]
MSYSPASVQLVVFDWAGTTIDFGSRAPAAAFKQVFAGQGVTVTDAEARAPMGLHKRDHLITMLQMPGVAERWLAAKGQPWTEQDVDTMYHEFMPFQMQALEQHCDLIPNVLTVATELRSRQIKLGGTTGYFQAALDLVSAAAKNAGFELDANVGADDVPQGRPAPWMIYEVMRRVGVYPPAAVVKIGDTLADIAAGRNAPCWTVGVCNSSSITGLSREELAALSASEREATLQNTKQAFEEAGSHFTIMAIDELPGVIDQINLRLASGEKP